MSRFQRGIRSTNRACTTSTASSRLRRMRSALRTSADPHARYAAWGSLGSLTASTLDAHRSARARLETIRDRAVCCTLTRAVIGAFLAHAAVAHVARAVRVLTARFAGEAVLFAGRADFGAPGRAALPAATRSALAARRAALVDARRRRA